jgi:hypothetical protein
MLPDYFNDLAHLGFERLARGFSIISSQSDLAVSVNEEESLLGSDKPPNWIY